MKTNNNKKFIHIDNKYADTYININDISYITKQSNRDGTLYVTIGLLHGKTFNVNMIYFDEKLRNIINNLTV